MDRSKFYQWFRTSIPWMLVCLGIIIFSFSEFYSFIHGSDTFETAFDKNWLNWLGGIGKAILISGISTVILNSFEYMGIFRGAMVEIVMGDAYLANRRDIDKHWEKVTLLLFKNRFPEINSQITTDLKEKYLPIETAKFYDKASQDITITLVNKSNQIVEVVSRTTFVINTWNPKQVLDHELENMIDCANETSDFEKFELVSFKIDGAEVVPQGERDIRKLIEGRWRLINELKIKNLTGKTSYEFDYTVKKTYSLKFDNLLYSLFQHIYKGFDIYFHLEGVELNIIKVGTVKHFETIKRTNKYIHLRYNGLIYPQQGYIAIINKL